MILDHRIRPRMLRRIAVLATALSGLVPALASASVVQDGYHLSPQPGIKANVRLISTLPGAGRCVLASVLGYSSSSAKQIEMGVVTCNGQTIDGTCGPATTLFVETYGGGVYTCYPHGAATLGSTYSVAVNQLSTTSATWRAYGIGTSYESQTGLSSTGADTYAWLEATGPGAACNAGWTGSASFVSVQRLILSPTSGTWAAWPAPAPWGSCAVKSAFNTTTGGFNVNH